MDRISLQSQPSTKRRDFMDSRRHLKDPSIKKADFMDGDGFSGGPSTERLVFVDGCSFSDSPSTERAVFMDGRQNSWQMLLTNKRKYVYLGAYERVLFGRLRAD